MTSIENKNNLVSYILFLVALFVLIFFTKDIALDTYAKFQETKQLELEQQQAREKWENYTKLKKDLESGNDNESEVLQKYAQDFSQQDFINFIYGYVENSNKQWSSSLVKTLTFSEPFENEIGFTQVDVNLTIKVSSLATMGQILRYLVSPEAKYKIFITDFSFPNDDQQGGFSVDIPMKVFYK